MASHEVLAVGRHIEISFSYGSLFSYGEATRPTGKTPTEQIMQCAINNEATKAWQIKEANNISFVDFLSAYAKGKEIVGKRKC